MSDPVAEATVFFEDLDPEGDEPEDDEEPGLK